MKKLARIVLALMLSFPLMFGGIFSILTSVNTQISQVVPQGGGGGTPITSDDDNSYPQENDSESEEITYTYKTYYDYFIDNMDCTGVYDTDGNLTNVTISAEKKAEILSSDFTGSGTSTDPYQVNSSLGFWYMSKFVTLSNKYVELNCDVILNDEHFDENGNASGGDGVVYSWLPIAGGKISEVNGNNNTIFGLYFNDCDKSKVGLFGSNFTKIENLEFKNLYICGSEYVSAIGGSQIDYVKNVYILNGYVKGSSYIAGVVASAKNIYYCKNYATVVCNVEYVGGVCGRTTSLISHCENYGEISCLRNEFEYVSMTLGGVCGSIFKAEFCNNYGKILVTNAWTSIGCVFGSFRDGNISHCNNYGQANISGPLTVGYSGGICGSGNGKIQYCNNYGTTECDSPAFSGIMGQTDKPGLIIDSCNFYGKIIAMRSCGILYGVGGTITNCGVYGYLKGEQSAYLFMSGIYFDTIIDNCKADCSTCHLYQIVVGIVSKGNYEGDLNNITISNLLIKISQDEQSNICFFGKQDIQTNINIKNIDITINTNSRCDVLFSSTIYKDTTVFADSIYVKVNSQYSSAFFNFYTSKLGKVVIDDMLCELNGATKYEKQYYGSSFRDFYLDWRTGKIGLNALDGVGTFQGKITEEWLKEKGYTKMN